MNGLNKLRVEKSRVRIDTVPIKTKKKRFFSWKRILFSCAFIIFVAIGWLVWSGAKTFKAISQGDGNIFKLFSKVSADQIKSKDGRTNILILGNGGENHPGGNLTDTIIIASIDLKNNKLALISIPRDLYVTIPGYGKGKINSAFSSGENDKNNSATGIDIAKATIKENFGLDIHYYAKANFIALTKLIDAVGGITVNVTKAINDPYYPDEKMIGYSPFKISAGVQKLDGKTALKYARSRETTNDFDRSRRQQEIILALKEKMLSAEIVTNPIKINEILSILGSHLKTDIGMPELKYFSSVAKEFTSDKITTKVFDTSPTGGLVAESGSAGYILVPKSGNFKAISQQIKDIFLTQSQTMTVQIVNASGKKTITTTLETDCEKLGFMVDSAKTATSVKTGSITVKDSIKGAQNLQKLKTKFNISSIKTDTSITTDFILTIGMDYGN